MPKKNVKRCIRPQCMMIYPENTKFKFCDCGALLELTQVEVANKKNNNAVKKTNNQNQKKKTSDKKVAIPEKNDVSSETVIENKINTDVVVEDVAETVIDNEETSISDEKDVFSEPDEQAEAEVEESDIESENELEEVDDEVSDEIDFFGVEESEPSSVNPLENVDTDDEIVQEENSEEMDFFGIDESDDGTRIDEDMIPEEPVEEDEITTAYLYLLLDDDEEVEYKLGKITRIGRASDTAEVDIDLTEYAGKDVSREHAIISKVDDGYYITNVSQNHSVRIIDSDGNEKAIEYKKKELLKSEEGILLSKKIFLQFVEEK